jgi:hypothetical protein
MPARPEPKAKVIMLTRSVRTPMQEAMDRFCITARICRPAERAGEQEPGAEHDEAGERDDEQPVVGEQHIDDQAKLPLSHDGALTCTLAAPKM